MRAPWADAALALIARGQAVALVTLTDVKGSAPRDAGARMVVWAEGQADTIGGGNLEMMVVEEARTFLTATPSKTDGNVVALDPAATALEREYPLGPILGQCCGGRVTIRIERLDASRADWLRREARSIELSQTPLYLLGAGHVGQAIAHALAPLPFRVDWFDTREEFADEAEFTADPRANVAAAPPGAFFLILTHNHDLDYELVRAVLARRDAAYCGLIGSESKRARFERQLRADGFSAEEIAMLICPIGAALDIKDKAPAVIAAAVAAELLQARERLARASADVG